MTGKQQTKPISRILAPSLTNQTIEAIVLLLLGALAMFVHARFRWGNANIPGHHGIEFMAILMACRLTTQFKWSSVFMVIGIGSMVALPFLGFKNPISALGYMLPVVALDLMYTSIPKRFHVKWLLAVLGGLAYAMVPIYRLVLSVSAGIPYPSALKHGSILIPIAGFFFFGLIGAGLAVGIVFTIKSRKK